MICPPSQLVILTCYCDPIRCSKIQRKFLRQISYCGIVIGEGKVSELFQRSSCRIQGLHLYRATEARSFESSYCTVKLDTELLGPVPRKPINLIQDWRKILIHVFNFLVKVSFAYFCFSRLTSSHVKFCQKICVEQHLGVEK